MPPAGTHHTSRWRYAVVAMLAVLFAGWTAAVAGHLLDGTDARLRYRALQPLSRTAQIWAGIAIVFHPIVTYCALLIAGGWALRRRLRNLALACVAVIPVAWAGEAALKHLFKRPRPEAPTSVLITAGGWAYPSGHLVAAVVVGLMLMAVVMTTRQRPNTIRIARVLAIAFVALIAADRWILSAHWVSDLVGSLLFGALAVAVVLLACRVHYLQSPWHSLQPADSVTGGATAAVVYNPAKVGDLVTFRQHIEYELKARGWSPPAYFETTPDDPGYHVTRRAIEHNYDLVMGAGGDGTIREICSALAGTGIPLGLLPAGTTNLLARNLGISLDETEALHTALDGQRSRIDLIRITPDDDPDRATHLDVMGGVGIDAATFANTDSGLKDTIGHAAYAVAAAQQWQENPATFTATITRDGGAPEKVEASMITFGNVGRIQGGFAVLPGAEPDDGLLNVAVFSQDSIGQWLRLATDVLNKRDIEGAEERTASRVELRLDDRVPFELDGDVVGECERLLAEIQPGALTIMLPHEARPA